MNDVLFIRYPTSAASVLNPSQYHTRNYKRNHTLHSSHMVWLIVNENVKVYPVPNSNPLMCQKPYFSSTNYNFSLGVRHLHVTLANDGTVTPSDRRYFSPCNYEHLPHQSSGRDDIVTY